MKRYPMHSGSFNLWREGIENRLFIPQFHGREHLNITSWLRALRSGNKDTLTAFDQHMFGISPRNHVDSGHYQSAFNIRDLAEIDFLAEVIRDGLNLFEELFGYRAAFFVPANGYFNNRLEKNLLESGIKYVGASKIQHEPIGNNKYKRRFHYMVKKINIIRFT